MGPGSGGWRKTVSAKKMTVLPRMTSKLPACNSNIQWSYRPYIHQAGVGGGGRPTPSTPPPPGTGLYTHTLSRHVNENKEVNNDKALLHSLARKTQLNNQTISGYNTPRYVTTAQYIQFIRMGLVLPWRIFIIITLSSFDKVFPKTRRQSLLFISEDK